MAVNSEESSLEYNATSPPGFRASRTFTGVDECQGYWFYIVKLCHEWSQLSIPSDRYYKSKQSLRTRRGLREHIGPAAALRLRYENSDEIGAFMKLTNSYCLLCCKDDSESLLTMLKGDLGAVPIINTTLAGCRVVGRMCVGNSKGLLVPDSIYDTEFEDIKNQLPDSVKVEKLEERLSALGNVIVCNDKVALIHPEINKESEQIIADTLQVEVFRHMIGNNPLVGSLCVLNNNGGLIQLPIENSELENLSSLLELPLVGGTVNRGCAVLASGLVINDFIAYAGMKTTSHEFNILEKCFHFRPFGLLSR